MNLVLVARSEDTLRSLASRLSARHAVAVEVLPMDLSREGAAYALHARCRERSLSVDLLINNAGFATHGTFEAVPQARQHALVMLNVTALMEATHLFLPEMLARGQGGILNVASVAGYQSLPYMATYAATKAFVLSFTEALWAENRKRGVRVVALSPGPVDTSFFAVVGSRHVSVGPIATAEQAARAGLRGLEKGRPSFIAGWRNWLQANVPRFVPRAVTVKVAAGVLKPRCAAALPAGTSAV